MDGNRFPDKAMARRFPLRFATFLDLVLISKPAFHSGAAELPVYFDCTSPGIALRIHKCLARAV
jgi:hypothetical protein